MRISDNHIGQVCSIRTTIQKARSQEPDHLTCHLCSPSECISNPRIVVEAFDAEAKALLIATSILIHPSTLSDKPKINKSYKKIPNLFLSAAVMVLKALV